MAILVSGCAGFIGFKVVELLLRRGEEVVGVDEINDYYDPRLKEYRLGLLKQKDKFTFHRADVADREAMRKILSSNELGAVINLAARAGVRASIESPEIYFHSNTLGNLNLLELSREFGVRKYILASTSSIYAGLPLPFREDAKADSPLSPYAASKKSAEITAYTYHHLYDLDISVLRYFTVYGPAGRPDMSVMKFIVYIDLGKPVPVYGDGKQERDFTYVDDIAEGTIRALKPLGYEIINLGNNQPSPLHCLISLIESELGKKARIDYFPSHRADIRATRAEISKAEKLLGWKPTISLAEGVRRTVQWYRENRHWVSRLKI